MKSKHLFIILILTLLSAELSAQSLIDKVGGIKTNYRIISDTNELNIISQVIVKRGIVDAKHGDNFDGGYAYGLESYNLEFMTTDTIYLHFKRGFGKYYLIKLFDENGAPLLDMSIDSSEVKKVSNGDDLNTYSINLRKIPFILLDKTEKIIIEGF